MAKKEYHQIKTFAGLQNLKNPRDIGFGLSKAQNVSIDKHSVIRTIGGLETHGDVPTQAAIIAPGYGLHVFDTDHKSGAAAKDTGENWLALADAVNGKIDLYNLTDDSFTASAIDLGTITTYTPAQNSTFDYETSIITLAAGGDFTSKIKDGDIVKIANTTNNNIIIVAESVEALTMKVRGYPLTDEAAGGANTITYTVLQTSVFHYVNEALRVASAAGGATMRPRHYCYTKRTHFPGLTDEEDVYNDWAAAGVGILAPSDLSVTAVDGDAAAGALSAGLGVEIGVAQNSDKGEWSASPDPGTIDWEVAISRIYEHGQESALYIPATAETFQTADNDSLDITVLAKTTGNSCGARTSGFRGYFRKEGSDDPWVLLVDIDLNKGARATLSGDYAAWLDGATANVVYTAPFDSFRQNVDTYESLTGINPETPHEIFSTYNSFWRCSLVAKNRTFIANLKYTDKDGNLIHYRDSLFYSQPNAYDLFTIDNEITVTKGDAEEPVQLSFFNDRVLMFKQETLYIVNITSGNDGDWFLESKHKFRGVEHPGAVTEMPHGIVWCNEFGVFFYNGFEIIELLKDKIELSEHPLAYQRYMKFDGDDDKVNVPDDADLDLETRGDYTIFTEVYMATISGVKTIIEKLEAGSQYYSFKTIGDEIAVRNKYSSEYRKRSNGAGLTAGWHTLGITGGIGSYIGYIDGSSIAVDTAQSNDDTPNNTDFQIGTSLAGQNWWHGNVNKVLIYNRLLSAAEMLALHNGQPVLAADQWGSQAEKITASKDRDFTGGNTNWENVSIGHTFLEEGDLTIRANAVDQYCKLPLTNFTDGFVTGKRYRLYYDYVERVAGWKFLLHQSGVDILIGTPVAGTNNHFDFIPTTTTGANGLMIWSTTSNVEGDFDNFSVIQIGCVAEYAPKAIGDATWEDQSGNSLDGMVVGATAIYEDSWAKFYTDYSILGYHALTNQLIIMRDCTGKRSSGQDYGDAFIIDLDTGFITTGRRVFTKGVAYTNFCIDWHQDLIIGEQSGANVIMKKWTDSPVSQAVGLIDVRTADFDMNNPAIKKIIDAFTATYKSSAAQTNPLSYALDCDDRKTAWTKLTGDLDPEGNWEKLIIEPESFNCDSIRLRISNPTNAGTIEINDVSLRHEEQPLKLE